MHLFRLNEKFALGWTQDGAAFVVLFDLQTIARAEGFLKRLYMDNAISLCLLDGALAMIASGVAGGE